MRVLRIVDGDETLIVRKCRVIETEEAPRPLPQTFAAAPPVRWPIYALAGAMVFAIVVAIFVEPIDLSRSSRMSENASELLRMIGS